CILGVAVRAHPQYPLIIVDNRDEYYTRPTKDAEIEESTGILCGRDMSAGGTWCGLHTKTGDFSVLTNVFEPNRKPSVAHPISRGRLVETFINGEYERDVDKSILPDWESYMGFNLVFGNLYRFAREQQKINAGEKNAHQPSIYYLSNRSSSSPSTHQEPKVQRLSQGVHVVSNSYMDDTSWPKVKFLKQEMEKILTQTNKTFTPREMRDHMARLLTSRPLLPESQVPQYIKEEIKTFCQSKMEGYHSSITSINSGITIQLEEFDQMIMQSCCNIFIDYCKKFKTKSQVVMLVDNNGDVYFYYRNTDELIVPEPLLPNEASGVHGAQGRRSMDFACGGWKEYKIGITTHYKKRTSFEYHH
ncbi:Tango2, partial [Acrasis kona]